MSSVRSLNSVSSRLVILMSVATVSIANFASATDPATRRQVMSAHLEYALGWDGTGVVLGQVELSVPHAHANVPFTARAGDVAGAYGANSNSRHALEVAGIMVSNDQFNRGMAPGARLFSDDSTNNAPPNDFDKDLDAFIWQSQIAPVARVVNASYGYNIAPRPPTNSLSKVSMGSDYLASQTGYLLVKSAGNLAYDVASPSTTVPADAVNGLAVGASVNPDGMAGVNSSFQGPVSQRWNRLAGFSSFGTNAGLMKPDLVAPGAFKDTKAGLTDEGIVMADDGNAFTHASGLNIGRVGTSYAAPHVSGISAQLIQGNNALDQRSLRAALLTGSDKTFRRVDDTAWTQGQNGLDNQIGAGMVNAWDTASVAIPGLRNPLRGMTDGNLAGGGATANVLVLNGVTEQTRVVATVAWDRNILRNTAAPNGNPPNEVYTVGANQGRFDILLDGPGGTQVISQANAGVTHLNFVVDQPGNYTLKVRNTGNSPVGAGQGYTVAYAASAPNIQPALQTEQLFLTVRDNQHRVNGAGADLISEGKRFSGVRAQSDAESLGLGNAGVESNLYRSDRNGSNGIAAFGTDLGLTTTATALDDHIGDISFGKDDIKSTLTDGARLYFSVDSYATGRPFLNAGGPNPIYNEAAIVNEAAGDVFFTVAVPDVGAGTNENPAASRNTPNATLVGNNGGFGTILHADSSSIGLTGPRTNQNEDDLTGIEGEGHTTTIYTAPNPNQPFTRDNLIFFTLDRDSVRNEQAKVLVARLDQPGSYKVFATPAQLGLAADDNIDALCVQILSGQFDGQGFPIFDPAKDLVLFSVDRDSKGAAGAVMTESIQGEVAGDLFLNGLTSGTNRLYMEGTDLGLMEFSFNGTVFGNNYNWLTDNLDALDLADLRVVIPEPTSLAFLAGLGVIFARRRT